MYVDFGLLFRVSNTPGNVLKLFFPPGNPENLLEIYKVSWKFSASLRVCHYY